MFVVKEIEDRLRKAENDKEALSRDVMRAEGKAKQIEMNQDQVRCLFFNASFRCKDRFLTV